MLNTHESGSGAELLDIQCALAALNVELKLCKLVRSLNYIPSQPRVPAGSPEGGQWASGSGGAGVGADSGTEADGDAQIQLAQGDPLQGYPVDLRDDEARGGHAIDRHVGKSESYLKTEVQEIAQGMVERGEDPRGLRVRSFTSLQSATKLVNSTLAQNRDVVDEVIRGERGAADVDAVFDSATGYEAYLPRPQSIPYMRDTYGVRVVIARDPGFSRGYRVQTAFPRND